MHKRTHISLVTLALTLLVPTTAYSASIRATETIAGLSADITVSELEPHASVDVLLQSPSGERNAFTLTADAQGIAREWVAGTHLHEAGNYTLTVDEETEKIEATLAVLPDSIDAAMSSIQVNRHTVDIQDNEEVIVQVTLRDRFGNPLSGRTAELISSRGSDHVHALTRETDSAGNQRFAVEAREPGTIALRAIDLLSGTVVSENAEIHAGDLFASIGGPTTAHKQFYRSNNTLNANLLGQTSSFQELGGFEITIVRREQESTPTLRINEAESMVIEAIDQNGNRFYDYDGTVYLLSTDPLAELPKDGVVAFGFRDQGMKQFTLGLTFQTPGEHTLIITEDPNNVENPLGAIDVLVTGQSEQTKPSANIIITEPLPGTLFNTRDITVEGKGPPFINVVVSGGVQEQEGGTDIDGNFVIPIQLDRESNDHVIQVRDKEGRYTSEERAIRTDTEPPAVIAATFTPSNPVEETDVLLVVETEPNLKSAYFSLQGEKYTLEVSGSDPGKYQVLFTAPEGGGVFEGNVHLTDQIGNENIQSTSLAVNLRGLPRVQNVIATPEVNAVALKWDPVESIDVSAYRIYVGTSEDEFIYTLDTDRPTAAATVAGLHPGHTYYFGVTALQDKRESEEKSVIVQAIVLGVNLAVTAGNGSLLLEFDALQNDMPLSHFILEYGTEPEKYTEQRRLNGELRAYTIRDLINGVQYYMKLIPVTTTGKRMEELAATGEGTPRGAGFTITSSDPIPFDLQLHAGAPTDLVTPPPTPQPINLSAEGLPSILTWAVIVLAVGLFALFMQKRSSSRRVVAFMDRMDEHYRHHV